MTLSTGTRLGPYEIISPLGAGGMGEVYRAHDTRLKRQVAIKVLPATLAADAERLARFQREAEVLAALNHPHIAAIYGLEETAGTKALVMELVEGEDLAQRLTRGAVPLDEALAIARQIADALEAAHDQGVIHRDLKPANIKVRPDGTVKVLDFGLAKLGAPSDPSSLGAALSLSPTVASPVMTATGLVLGTAAYMSPEQARGKAVDSRADIWAFGCVLYEMLAGSRPFDGDDVMSAIGAAIHKEPQWNALPASTPPTVRSTLARCLQKDPKQRARHIGDVRLALEGGFGGAAIAATPASPARRSNLLAAIAAGVAGLAAGGLLIWSLTRPVPTPAPPAWTFDVSAPNGQSIDNFFALSPDARMMAYSAADREGRTFLWMHSFETGVSRQLSRITPIRSSLVWSLDGRFVAYATGTTFVRTDINGGTPLTITNVSGWAGGSWLADDTILFGRVRGGLMRVAAEGGTPTEITTIDASARETGHTNPSMLGDGRHFIYYRASLDSARSGVYIGSIDAKPAEQPHERFMATTEAAVYARSPNGSSIGQVLYLREGALFGQTFDDRTLKLVGEPQQLADSVGVGPIGYAHLSVSRTGVLAYRRAEIGRGGSPIWFDRNGRELGALVAGVTSANFPRISPDGKRVALILDGDIWIYDISGRPPIRLTRHDGTDVALAPLWTPDGSSIAYEVNLGGGVALLPIDGSAATRRTITLRNHYHPTGWSGDGRELLVAKIDQSEAARQTASWDILRVPIESPQDETPVVATPAEEGMWGATLSPKKTFLAYVSNSTGANEVWVRPFPGPGAAERVSPNGGTEPLWSADGRELVYLERNRFMSVKTTTDGTFTFSAPSLLFETPVARSQQPPSYDLAADGRLLVLKYAGNTSLPINVIVNWQALIPPAREATK